MKKAYLLIAIVLFLFFAYFGYKAASDLDTKSANAEPVTLDLAGTQQNFLLIHVNDLASSSPKLISVWGVFIVFNNPPQLIILPLYPTNTLDTAKILEKSFDILRTKGLDPEFIDSLESQYKIHTSGYILVDNASVSSFRKWLTGKDETLTTSAPRTPDENNLILYNGQEFFQALCKDFTEVGARPFFNSIKWTQVLPEHFFTNLSFESFTLAQDLLKTAGKIAQCNVLSND